MPTYAWQIFIELILDHPKMPDYVTGASVISTLGPRCINLGSEPDSVIWKKENWCDVAQWERMKLVVKNFSETFVKNALDLL